MLARFQHQHLQVQACRLPRRGPHLQALRQHLLDDQQHSYTPPHGSWLNIAEIELSVLDRQYLDRRIGDAGELSREVATWMRERNAAGTVIDWRFTTADARIKLKRLYPAL